MDNQSISIFGNKIFLEIIKEIKLFSKFKIKYYENFDQCIIESKDLDQPAIFFIKETNIRQITNKSYPSGSVIFKWDGRTKLGQPASSGQYFIVVEGNNFQRWINTTLLK